MFISAVNSSRIVSRRKHYNRDLAKFGQASHLIKEIQTRHSRQL